jgi:hypothetical protein
VLERPSEPQNRVAGIRSSLSLIKPETPPTMASSTSGPGAGSRSAALALLVDFAEAILQALAFLAVRRVGEPVAYLVLGAFEPLAMLAERLLFAPALVWCVARRRIT